MSMLQVARRYAATVFRAYLHLRVERQLAFFLIFALLFVWSMVAVELGHLKTSAENATKRDVLNLAHAFSEEVNSSVSTIDLSLINLRAHWLRDRKDFRETVAKLQQHLKDHISFHVSMVDAQGKLTFSSVDPTAGPIDVSDREHISVHKEGAGDRLFISKPVLSRVSKQWSIQFTRPVYTLDGQYDGVIVISIAPSYFSRFFHEIDMEGAVVALVRTGGVVIARSPRQDEGKGMGLVLTGPPFETAPNTATGFFRRVSQVDGVERYFAWRALPRHDLIVVVGQSVDATFAQYRSQQRAYLVGAAGISALLAIVGYMVLFAVRQRAIANEALAESEARWKFALEGAQEGVWDWNIERKTVQLSKPGREILGVENEIKPGNLETLYSLVHPDEVESVRAALRAHLDGATPTYVMEHRTSGKKSAAAWVLVRGMVVKRSEDGRPLRMVGTFKNISERKAEEELMKHLAQHDALTGLPNRVLFEDRLRQALLNARRDNTKLAVIYFDLDKFKPVNDTYGHAVGDLLLKEVASRVLGCLRKSDTIARIGGDEFVALLPSVSAAADAVTIAENFLMLLNKPFEIEGHTLNISGSIGVATYPVDGQDEAALTRCADKAMYRAKDSGRKQVQIYAVEKAA